MTIVPPVRERAVAPRMEALSLDDRRWVTFVQDHPGATVFHLPAWASAVAECYGFRAFALAAVTPAGDVVAGVPVVEVSKPLGRGRRKKWVALPFTDHCPPLSADVAEATSWSRLVRTRLDFDDVPRLQVRAACALGQQQAVAVRHVLALDGDLDAVYSRLHRSQVQRNIRRADREGVTVRTGDRRADLLETYYRLHLQTRRRQGVPVQPRRFFDQVWQRVIEPGHGSVLVAEHRGEPIAAAVFLRHNGTVIYKYGASDDAAWSVRPNHALFWHAIRAAVAMGDTAFDWGRTDLDNAGLRAFKSAWGAVEEPLHYTTFAVSGPESLAAGHNLAGSRAARMLATVIRHGPPWVCSAVGEALYRFTA